MLGGGSEVLVRGATAGFLGRHGLSSVVAKKLVEDVDVFSFFGGQVLLVLLVHFTAFRNRKLR